MVRGHEGRKSGHEGREKRTPGKDNDPLNDSLNDSKRTNTASGPDAGYSRRKTLMTSKQKRSLEQALRRQGFGQSTAKRIVAIVAKEEKERRAVKEKAAG